MLPAVRDQVTAVGFRAHMGWANAVVLAAANDTVVVRSRSEVDLRPGDAPVHPYHAVARAPVDVRERLVAEAIEDAEATAIGVLGDLLADDIEAVGVVISPGVRHTSLDRILASNRLLHMAEATVYQQALRGAAAALCLPCVAVPFAQAEAHELWPVVEGLGKTIGPPWRKDHKFAAMAAWLAASSLVDGG